MAEHNRGKGIVENIMRSPGIVILLVTVLCVFGVYGLINMNKQEFPEFSVRLGVVAGVYPGANAEQVEEQLTEPLEDFLFSYEEVDKRNTFSVTKNGITYIYVVLDETVENDGQAWSKIRHGLKDFKATLPPGVLAISVNDDFGNTTSLLITLSSADKNYRELGTYMGLLEDRLREVPAIGNIKRYGDCHEEIAVRLDKEKITSYGIDAKTVFATLFPQGLLSIGGSLELDGYDVPLEVTVPFTTEKEIGEQVVAFTASGNMVRLKDIAVIERRYDNPSSYITHDRVKSLVLSVEMRSGNNIVQFGKEVNAIIDEFGNGLPDSVEIRVRVPSGPDDFHPDSHSGDAHDVPVAFGHSGGSGDSDSYVHHPCRHVCARHGTQHRNPCGPHSHTRHACGRFDSDGGRFRGQSQKGNVALGCGCRKYQKPFHASVRGDFFDKRDIRSVHIHHRRILRGIRRIFSSDDCPVAIYFIDNGHAAGSFDGI